MMSLYVLNFEDKRISEFQKTWNWSTRENLQPALWLVESEMEAYNIKKKIMFCVTPVKHLSLTSYAKDYRNGQIGLEDHGK